MTLTSPSKMIKKIYRLLITRQKALSLLKKYHGSATTNEDRIKWSLNFGSEGIFTIKAIQKNSEILSLVKAVEDLKPEIIMEIGTFKGGTLLLWSALASRKVISCDLEMPKLKASFLKKLAPPNSSCQIKLLKGSSHDAEFKERIKKELNGEQLDFLFIDGDHTLKGVTADFEDYRELVRPGGIIAFHDIIESQPEPDTQVYPLWEKIKHDYRYEEYIENENQCGYGIGILYLPID